MSKIVTLLLLISLVIPCTGCDINSQMEKQIQEPKNQVSEKIIPSKVVADEPLKQIASVVEDGVIGSAQIILPNEVGTYNAGVAANILDGYILESGKVFSYNQVIGKRTADKGYKYGNMPVTDANGNQKMISSLGSGVCRLSVALATTVKNTGLKQIEITRHTYTPGYFNSKNPGLVDATVYWPSTDNKFQNTMPYDIKIKSWLDEEYILHVEFVKLDYIYE